MKEFEREADLLLNKIPPHENIVKVYDVRKKEYEEKCALKVDLWLITELCTLGNLSEYAQQRDLSTEEKLELMYQAALAVRHLHQCKPEPVAHRDIKPQNILVTGSEDKPVIKLCDFGSARNVLRDNHKSVLMMSLAGTPNYFAPEQTELNFPYDKTVDT